MADVVTYTLLMNLCEKASQWPRALELSKDMAKATQAFFSSDVRCLVNLCQLK